MFIYMDKNDPRLEQLALKDSEGTDEACKAFKPGCFNSSYERWVRRVTFLGHGSLTKFGCTTESGEEGGLTPEQFVQKIKEYGLPDSVQEIDLIGCNIGLESRDRECYLRQVAKLMQEDPQLKKIVVRGIFYKDNKNEFVAMPVLHPGDKALLYDARLMKKMDYEKHSELRTMTSQLRATFELQDKGAAVDILEKRQIKHAENMKKVLQAALGAQPLIDKINSFNEKCYSLYSTMDVEERIRLRAEIKQLRSEIIDLTPQKYKTWMPEALKIIDSSNYGNVVYQSAINTDKQTLVGQYKLYRKQHEQLYNDSKQLPVLSERLEQDRKFCRHLLSYHQSFNITGKVIAQKKLELEAKIQLDEPEQKSAPVQIRPERERKDRKYSEEKDEDKRSMKEERMSHKRKDVKREKKKKEDVDDREYEERKSETKEEKKSDTKRKREDDDDQLEKQRDDKKRIKDETGGTIKKETQKTDKSEIYEAQKQQRLAMIRDTTQKEKERRSKQPIKKMEFKSKNWEEISKQHPNFPPLPTHTVTRAIPRPTTPQPSPSTQSTQSTFTFKR